MVKIWIGPIMERTNMERPLPDMSAMNTPHLWVCVTTILEKY